MGLIALPRTVVYMQHNMTVCNAYFGIFNIPVASYDIFPDLTRSIRKVSQNSRNRDCINQEILCRQSNRNVQSVVKQLAGETSLLHFDIFWYIHELCLSDG